MYRAEFLFHHIDELVDDNEVYPICVPTYNRPNAYLVKNFADKLPIVIFIRREQEELYSEYKGVCPIVLLDNVTNIGETRAAIVDWAYQSGYNNIFMMDDDISCGTFLVPGKSSKSDKYFMKFYETVNNLPWGLSLKFFKMWVWMIKHCDEKLTLSGPGARSDFWDLKNADMKLPYNSNSVIQCIHLNVSNLKENNINYGSNEEEGAEDYALQYKLMTEGLYSLALRDLAFVVPGVGSGTGGNNAIEEEKLHTRYKEYIRRFMENVLDEENAYRVGTKTSKGGIPSVKFNWLRWKIKDKYFYYSVESIQKELDERLNNESTQDYV